MKETSISLTLKQIQEEELKILKKIVEFCEKNGIKYYLCAGTLLGAIRHKGFIPWDDDIDICMPRPDIEKFKDIVRKQGNYIDKDLEVCSYDLNNSPFPFCKVRNKNIEVDTVAKKKYEEHLWIDIFPLDGLAENKYKRKIDYKKEAFLKKMLYAAVIKKKGVKKGVVGKLKLILKVVLLDYLPLKKLAKKIDDIGKKHDYNTSKYIGGIVYSDAPQEQVLKVELNDMEVEFEGIKLNTFSYYDEHLSKLYGNDYMQLPPVDKRRNHIFSAKKIIKG